MLVAWRDNFLKDLKSGFKFASVFFSWMFIATYFQKIPEGAHGTEKPLGIAWIFKFSHLPFFLPSWLMAVFYNIIEPLMAAVFGRFAYNPVCFFIASQLVGTMTRGTQPTIFRDFFKKRIADLAFLLFWKRISISSPWVSIRRQSQKISPLMTTLISSICHVSLKEVPLFLHIKNRFC